jgi:hypothetical protein
MKHLETLFHAATIKGGAMHNPQASHASDGIKFVHSLATHV